VVCEWHDDWSALPVAQQAVVKARQGVRYPVLEGLMVADPGHARHPVTVRRHTMGEVFMRGNVVMKGYLKNPKATKARSGRLVPQRRPRRAPPDGYIELKDRSKDIIISGGENISTIEVESGALPPPGGARGGGGRAARRQMGRDALRLRDPASAAPRRAPPTSSPSAASNLAGFKVPKTVVFGALPKTSTGKVQKFVLRERARRALSRPENRNPGDAWGASPVVIATLWGAPAVVMVRSNVVL
jgi:fatty-acyl-CoA synthase